MKERAKLPGTKHRHVTQSLSNSLRHFTLTHIPPLYQRLLFHIEFQARVVPHTHCIYLLLIKHKHIVYNYIGKTKDLVSRLISHIYKYSSHKQRRHTHTPNTYSQEQKRLYTVDWDHILAIPLVYSSDGNFISYTEIKLIGLFRNSTTFCNLNLYIPYFSFTLTCRTHISIQHLFYLCWSDDFSVSQALHFAKFFHQDPTMCLTHYCFALAMEEKNRHTVVFQPSNHPKTLHQPIWLSRLYNILIKPILHMLGVYIPPPTKRVLVRIPVLHKFYIKRVRRKIRFSLQELFGSYLGSVFTIAHISYMQNKLVFLLLYSTARRL